MATDLVGNVKLQEFISLLSDLNHQSVDAIKTGDTRVLEKMNVTVERMYEIQHNGTEDAYTAIEEDMQIIYKNFDAISVMINSTETQKIDQATSTAVKKFLHNIFDATVRIVIAYGLA
jgi:hypothetical protein